MEQWAFITGWIGLLALTCLAATAGNSLREFSRSHLEETCRARGRPELFGVILSGREPVQLAVAIIHAIAVAAVTAWWVAWWIDERISGSAWSWVGVVSSLVAALLLVDVLIPWSVAHVGGEAFLVRCWSLLRGLSVIVAPILTLARWIDRILHRVAGRGEPVTGDLAALSEEVRVVVDEGQRGGLLKLAARTMIHRVMDLHDEDVAAVMTPRTDMVCIDVGDTLEEARRKLLDAGHTRVPVVGESTDDIVGILYAKDLLGHLQSEVVEKVPRLRDIVREPFYIPATTGIDTLLETLKRKQIHLAIVLDEYGGVAGLVTLEDILEEIVGEIEDEYDVVPGKLVQPIRPGVVDIDARAHIDDLNEQFGYGLPEDGDFDTLGGFVMMRLGRIPVSGERLTWEEWQMTIHDADKRRVKLVRVQRSHLGPGGNS